MNFDGIKFTEGSHAENLVVDSGPTFPANPGQSGELFYIDGTGNVNFLKGSLDEIRFTSVARYLSNYSVINAEFPNK